MEGDFDSSHLSFLHLAFDPTLHKTTATKQRESIITATSRTWTNSRCLRCMTPKSA
jgi:hypothetical protein